ncbi:glucokinase family protein [Xanthomonas bonasiae]|uniref:glucokinase family protein n=1 Tax=Xanthomonas bonasiae TaxID=2810351 RepID=UPI001781EEA0|nr:glucokinase family protein [Xanthomonas surreyensis]MBD7923995.1 glucokinase [Xanthomonas surreyensis]
MSASSSPMVAASPRAEPFIAADVGGTHVRIGLMREDGDLAHPVTVLDYRKYRCADYPGLAEIIGEFLAEVDGEPVTRGVIASAGYALEDGSVITTNLPWKLSPPDIRERLGLSALHLVNDFEAVAYAASYMGTSEVLHLTGPRSAQNGPALIIGPGTGLGAAVWIPTGDGAVVLATEAGHAALTACTALEMDLVRHVLNGKDYVPVEHLLSGPGLLNLYRALCALRGAVPVHAAPSEVTAGALAVDDALAHESLSVFCGLLGSMVGDMALLYGIQSGIYLAGGFLPQIGEFLAASSFVERYLNKGAMRPALEQIPVKLVEHGQLGVIGAANWFLQQQR